MEHCWAEQMASNEGALEEVGAAVVGCCHAGWVPSNGAALLPAVAPQDAFGVVVCFGLCCSSLFWSFIAAGIALRVPWRCGGRDGLFGPMQVVPEPLVWFSIAVSFPQR